MPNVLRTLLLMALGAAELTEERVDAALDELVARGELAEREARLLASRWQRQRLQEEAVVTARLEERLRAAFDRELAPLSELRALEERVERLDRRVRELSGVEA